MRPTVTVAINRQYEHQPTIDHAMAKLAEMGATDNGDGTWELRRDASPYLSEEHLRAMGVWRVDSDPATEPTEADKAALVELEALDGDSEWYRVGRHAGGRTPDAPSDRAGRAQRGGRGRDRGGR